MLRRSLLASLVAVAASSCSDGAHLVTTADLDARPQDASQHASGTLDLTGVVATDGTRFAPIEITTGCIGCYSG